MDCITHNEAWRFNSQGRLHKVLIANRGEIGVRILRACRELGIPCVAVYSTADADSMHVRLADERVCIGPPASGQSYLNIPAILSAAEITGATAIHPGFGFLSENAVFAEIVEAHGLIFIGPSPKHIAQMGGKTEAKQTAQSLGLPVIPGSEILRDFAHCKREAESIGFPLLIKAVAGGGGKGIKKIQHPSELEEAYTLAAREAEANFKNADLYLERCLENPRHIEFQILGDGQGQVWHFGERDCSVQRRYQKIWEEAPSPVLSMEQRCQMGEKIVRAMGELKYRSLGTLEFLYEKGEFYFMEMNTRVQVEHPITEMVTGVDLVKTQIELALGKPCCLRQEDIGWRGHAIECRINAEDPETFAPSPGTVSLYSAPGGPGIRIDSHLFQGYKVPPHYDSLLAKLIVHDKDREACIQRVRRALQEYVIVGVKTLIPLHQKLCDAPEIQSGDYHVLWLQSFLEQSLMSQEQSP